MLSKALLLAAITLLYSYQAIGGCIERAVSITCNPCTMEEALSKLEAQINCSFSYSPDQLDPEMSVNIKAIDEPLLQVLRKLTEGKYEIRERSRYILMTRKVGVEVVEPKRVEYVIEGRITNAETGEFLERTTVYAVGRKSSTLSNSSGYYKLKVTSEAEFVSLSYSKQMYFDTILVVRPIDGRAKQDIKLYAREAAPPKMPIRTSIEARPKEVEELTMVKFLVPEPQREMALNLSFLENIPVQLSLVPSLGTNKFTSGAKRNILSINLISGYNAGVEGLEVGGMVNINRESMTGIQGAGIGNIVGGKVQGLQAAGIFNNVRGSVSGVQAAGLYNIVLDTVRGVQAAGMFNILRGTIQGAQLSGLFNVATENMTGLQAAGFMNYTKEDVKFAQTAGFLNLAGKVSGAQIAGYANICKGEVNGVQVSGFVNAAKEITGAQLSGFANISGDASTQISGFINIGKKIDGLQLGVFNISDTSALSIGVLSFSRKGFNHIDFHSDLLHPYNVSVRMGSRHFYNVLQFSYGSYVGLNLYSYGYGFGTEIGKPKQRLNLDLELTGRQVYDPNNKDFPFNLNTRFEPSLVVRLGKKRPSIVIGPSANLMISNGTLQNTDPDAGKSLTPRQSYPDVFDAVNGIVELDFWLGGKVAFRI